MKFKLMSLILLLLAPSWVLARSMDGATAEFTVAHETMVPGTTLTPGKYSIQVMDHLPDRFVLRIEGGGGAAHTVFLGVPSRSLKSGAHDGLITYSSGPDGKNALRGFAFQGSKAIEFVYPKEEAVALAKLNDDRVLAVDPASEGKSANLANLSKDEMQMVTLWMLTPKPVSGSAPEISASKYGSEEARLTAPVKSLPHTASPFPAILLIGLLSAFGATWLMVRRKTGATAGRA